MRTAFRKLALITALLAAPAGSAAGRVMPGDVAPPFTFTDVRNGNTVSLSDYEGRVVVLIFFWYY